MDTQTLEKIKSFANEKYSQSKGQHNIHHVERVSNNSIKIMDILHDRIVIDKNLLQAICYLHDFVLIKQKPNIFLSLYNHFFEKSLNRKRLYDLIIGFDLPDEEMQILMNAIINHPYSIPYHRLNRKKDIYSKILQDADSLDYISKERMKFSNLSIKLFSPFIKIYLYLVKKGIKHFLNFPELAQNLSLFE